MDISVPQTRIEMYSPIAIPASDQVTRINYKKHVKMFSIMSFEDSETEIG